MYKRFLFVTANDNEKIAFLDKFKNDEDDRYVDGVRYKKGRFGNYPVVFLHLKEQGNDSPNSTPLIEKLIRDLHETGDTEIVGVVMVGIAYGVDEQDQKIGDILVATKILNVDRKKERNGITIFDTAPKDTGRILGNAFSDTEDWDYKSGNVKVNVHCGLVFSGGTLVDDYNFRQNLIDSYKRQYPESPSPIGGEMEGYGLYTACESANLINMYILIKGICDWGHDKQNSKKEEWQKVASASAVDFCHTVFSRKGIFDKICNNTIWEESQKKTEVAIQTVQNQEKTIQWLTSANTQLFEEKGKAVDENSRLVKEKYNEILQVDINCGSDTAWKMLRPIVDDVANANNTSYASYYSWAAQYCLQFDTALSERYFSVALKLSPNLDTRIYESFKLMREGEFDKVAVLLENIDSVAILNQRLNLALTSESDIDIEDLLANIQVEKNEYTDYFIGLCYFTAKNYERAIEHINLALAKFPNSARMLFSLGCVYYWKALGNLLDSKPTHGFPIYYRKPQITFIQKELLQKSLECFIQSYESNLEKENEFAVIALTGCMYSSWILDSGESISYRNKLLKIEPFSGVALTFNWIRGTPVDGVDIDELERRVFLPPYDDLLLVILINHLLATRNLTRAIGVINKFADLDPSSTVVQPLKVDIALSQDNYIEALSILELCDNMPPDESGRLKLQILMRDKSTSKNSKIDLAKKLKRLYRTDIDYHNLCKVLNLCGNYKSMLKISKEWYEAFSDISALSYEILALHNLHEHDLCLERIDNYEVLSELSVDIRRIKAYCYIGKSQLDEAIAILGDERIPDCEETVIQLAGLYKTKGNLERAVSILTEFVNTNNIPKNATLLLCECLKTSNNHECFKYLNLLVGKYPEDKSLKHEWYSCGINTGHENEVASFWAEMKPRKMPKRTKNFNKPYVFSLNGKQVIEFMEQQREIQKEQTQAFSDCKIPIHALINNRTLAEPVYNWWNERFYGHYIHYGGRQFDIPNGYDPKSIVMDYSALLCAYCLNIFPKLEKHFTEIFVSPNIFHLIDSEISKLSNVQKNRYDSNKKLYDFLKRNPTQITIITGVDKIEEIDNVWEGDTYVHRCAVSVNAYVVNSSSGTEMFCENKLPNEYEKMRIGENEVVAFLNDNGIDVRLSDKKCSVKKQQGLKMGDGILVDQFFLEELQNQIDLTDITSFLSLYITEREYLSIEGSLNATDSIRNCEEWLKGLKLQITNLFNKGFLKFYVPCTENKSLPKMQENRLFEVIVESLNYSIETKTPIWCDDRMFVGYHSNIFNTPTILKLLHQRDVLTNSEYNKNISDLIARGVFYYIPDVEYILNCLKTAQYKESEIIESPKLTKLRRSILFALHEEVGVSKKAHPAAQIPECAEYILNLHDAYLKTMLLIWSDTTKPVEWKAASASWCLMYLSDFAWDFHFMPTKNVFDSIVNLQFELLSICHKLMTLEMRQQYCNWLFWWFDARWKYNTEEPAALISMIADFINNFKSPESPKGFIYSDEDCQKISLLYMAQYLPDNFLYHLLHSPVFNGKWEELIKFTAEEITVDLINEDVAYKTIGCDDLVEYLNNNPEQWSDVIFTAICDKKNQSAEVVAFMKSYVKKHGIANLTKECLDYLKHLAWVSLPEERLAFQELKRMLL